MGKILIRIGAGFAVALVAFLIFVATRPDSFRVERSAQIQAPPAEVFGLIDDLRAFRTWSPWENRDPNMQTTHSGAERGKGAVYAWDGNDEVGQGRMEITDSQPNSKVTMRLDFLRPFEAHNTVEFTLEPVADDPGATRVTWAMMGPSPFMSKLMGVLMDMDQMIGRDFEEGLANLKTVAER